MLRGDDPERGIDCSGMLMMLEGGPQTGGWKGSTLNYRKIQGLERDLHYREYLASPLFRAVATGLCPGDEGVAIFRSMFFNKPSAQLSGGSVLGWHQDMGAGFNCDRNPLVTVYLALDDATVANGCMHVVRGSHTEGVLSGPGKLLSDPGKVAALDLRSEALELLAGEVLLLSPFLLHTSGTNSTTASRRAFSVELMPEHTRTRDGNPLQATVLFPGGRRGLAMGIDPHFLPKSPQSRSSHQEQQKRWEQHRQREEGAGGPSKGRRPRL